MQSLNREQKYKKAAKDMAEAILLLHDFLVAKNYPEFTYTYTLGTPYPILFVTFYGELTQAQIIRFPFSHKSVSINYGFDDPPPPERQYHLT